ncbi:MAG: precorrin-4 C(11)-methyltransferase [Oligoflexia bacterium]|nr:precorrin-4 C(11)-methyltransferase [Oligoflexia bacterium]
MKVYFIGAGPGDPELLTVKASKIIARAPIIIYAGSLVSKRVLEAARADAKIYNSASMNLEEIMAVIKEAKAQDLDVARVHTGDTSLFSSLAEQTAELACLGVEWEIVPGVSSFSAAAMALGKELTLPEVSQTIILTRFAGRTKVPAGEDLQSLAKHHATMVIFLSITMIAEIVEELLQVYDRDFPIAVVYKASWPEQKVIRATLATIESAVAIEKIRATALIVVGNVLRDDALKAYSKLYDANFSHDFREGKEEKEKWSR